ncbi:MAG: DUF72 domain-containing protein [Bacteroidota bacterium]
MEEFLYGVKGFGEQCGPVFIQFSDNFGPKRFAELHEYLNTFPKDVNFFVEVRDPGWFNKETIFDTLKDLNIGSVITGRSRPQGLCSYAPASTQIICAFCGE